MYTPIPHHTLYDKILRELPKDLGLSGFGDYHDVDLRYLESCGYIDIRENSSGQIYLISLTRDGLKFISEGGFVEHGEASYEREEYQKTLDAKNIKINTKMMWISGGSLAISGLAIIITTLSNQTTSDQIVKVNARVDSLNLESSKSFLNMNQQKGNEIDPVKEITIDTTKNKYIPQK